MTIRTLVLSGGGGRGAFHGGVYKYLMQSEKPGVDDDHQGAWIPDIVAGTSIGAVNGAAIVQGISAEYLERFWLSLREQDIQGLPPGMRWLARRLVNHAFKRSIGVRLPPVSADEAFSPEVDHNWLPLPFVPNWIKRRLVGYWSNLLDTAPLYKTLTERLGLDEQAIAKSDKTLFINATNVRTGEGVVFCNRSLYSRMSTGTTRLKSDITIRRIIASCSIPLVYPWTIDTDGEIYWDGAVVSNTPLGSAFDSVRERDITEEMEVVIVMMTPWWELGDRPVILQDLPGDFTEAMTWTLDWGLLASFRVSLKMLRVFNKVAEQQVASGQEQTYRIVKDMIVAPDHFLPAARILDYDEDGSRNLIQMGYRAAEEAFQKTFRA